MTQREPMKWPVSEATPDGVIGAANPSVRDVAGVAKSMQVTAWRQYVEVMVAGNVLAGLSQVPESLSWPPEALADRAVSIARLVADRIVK